MSALLSPLATQLQQQWQQLPSVAALPALQPALRYRTVFISDIHLGTTGCQAEPLIEFLRHLTCEHLFLVGDVFDGWQLEQSWHWPASHQQVLAQLLRLQAAGVKLAYLPGNHDEMARAWCGQQWGGIPIADEMIHHTQTGQRILVLHGDQFDDVMGHAKWLAHIGDTLYTGALLFNRALNRFTGWFGLPYWSVSAPLKHLVKRLVKGISTYQARVKAAAARHQAQIVVCGHVHYAERIQMDDITYFNDGDWVESCTALVEDNQGQLQLIHWLKQRKQLLRTAA